MTLKLNEFLAQRAVFTVTELNAFLAKRGSCNSNTRKSLLTYHRNQGRIVPVRRGLYATVPFGSDPAVSSIDPFLVAAKSAPDAVLAYHTALEFHGKAYSVHSRLFYLSGRKSLPFLFRSHEYKAVPVSLALRSKGQEKFGVASHNRSGVEVHVTDLERTFVDLLDRPDLSGSWEEIWRSLESIEFFDIEKVTRYVQLLENATTAAKVGYFLDQHREALMLDEASLAPLRKLIPRQPHYLSRGKRKGERGGAWNLMVPQEILNRSWAEVP